MLREVLQDSIFPVSLLTPKMTLPYACSSQIQGFPAIYLTLPFAYSHMSSLQSGHFRLLLGSADGSLTVGNLTRYCLRVTRMYLSQMFPNAGSHREKRGAILHRTRNAFVPLIFRLGPLMLKSYMVPHFVFPRASLKFLSQVLTATTMPFPCIRVMPFFVSLQLLFRSKGRSVAFEMHAAVLGSFGKVSQTCQCIQRGYAC